MENKEMKYTLSKKTIVFLFIYYSIYLLIGLIISIATLFNINSINSDVLLRYTLVSSLSVSSMLCSVRYIKKIYKACIEERIIQIEKDKFSLHGNMAYFIFRPIFACIFAIIAIVGMLSGMFIVTTSLDYILNIRFLYLSLIISSIIGYSTGKVLDKFEDTSNKKIEKLL